MARTDYHYNMHLAFTPEHFDIMAKAATYYFDESLSDMGYYETQRFFEMAIICWSILINEYMKRKGERENVQE